MKLKFILITIILLFVNITNSQITNVVTQFNLLDTLQETSGLIYFNNKLISHNDSGGSAELHEFTTTSNTITRSVEITNATNSDWEDIAQDDNYIYIGDFGNNLGTRTDLKIYRISKTDYTNNTSVTADVINFSYNDQTSFDSDSDTNFDCEGFVIHNNEILLFSKNWGDEQTRVYTLPKTLGTHVAMNIGTYDVQGLITGATYNTVQSQIFLTGYSSTLVPFVVYLGDYVGNDVFGGTVDKTNILSLGYQVEGIANLGNNEYYVSNEKFTYSFLTWDHKLHSFESDYSLPVQRALISNVTGGGSVSPSGTTTYNHGTIVTVTATPNAGWLFDHWTGDASGSISNIDIVMDADKTVEAVFIPIDRELTTTNTGNGVVTPSGTTIHSNGDIVAITATADAGWVFDHWSGDASGSTNPYDITMDADKTVEAVFILADRELTTTNTGNGVVTPSGTTYYTDGTIVTITATANIGWEFDHWSGDASGSINPIDITMATNKAVEAVFIELESTLTTSVNGNGVVSPNGVTTHVMGSNVTITATADIGWEFDHWTGDASGTSNPLTITMDTDKTIDAVFVEIEYELTIISIDGTTTPDIGTLNGGVYKYNYGTVVNLTATPNNGYTFIEYEILGIDTSSSNPYSLTINNDVTVKAIFAVKSGIEKEYIPNISIYPNPTTNTLNIKLDEQIRNIEVLNIKGQKIIESNSKTINVSSLSSGIYFVRINMQSNKSIVRQFIKK